MGELSQGNCWEPLRSDPGHAFHTCSALQWGGLLNTFYQGPGLSDVFFGGLLFPLPSGPCTWQPIWELPGQISWRTADRSTCSGPRWWWESGPEVKEGDGGWWWESERWKWRMEGRRTQESGASDPQGPGLTQRRALSCVLPASSLLHLHLHCSVTQD